MIYQIISNLFGKDGRLDLEGDEGEINVSAITYLSSDRATDAVYCLATRYPNAFVDLA